MKRISRLLLALVLVLGMAGCSTSGDAPATITGTWRVTIEKGQALEVVLALEENAGGGVTGTVVTSPDYIGSVTGNRLEGSDFYRFSSSEIFRDYPRMYHLEIRYLVKLEGDTFAGDCDIVFPQQGQHTCSAVRI